MPVAEWRLHQTGRACKKWLRGEEGQDQDQGQQQQQQGQEQGYEMVELPAMNDLVLSRGVIGSRIRIAPSRARTRMGMLRNEHQDRLDLDAETIGPDPLSHQRHHHHQHHLSDLL